MRGRVAQLVERETENLCVGGSTPSLATTSSSSLRPLRLLLLGLPLLVACGDRCEALCQDLSRALERCMPEAMGWEDLGARNRAEYALECERDWDRRSAGLSARELELALDLCRGTREDLEGWSCDTLLGLYAPLD